jgi:transcriptional regulator with XRE-family HTH domain
MKRTAKASAKASDAPKSPVELVPGPDVGRSIRMLRASEGITQAELEEMTGVNRSSLSAYESGRRRPRAATIARIAAAVESRPPTAPGAAALADSIAERVRALAEAALAEVAARLAGGAPLF